MSNEMPYTNFQDPITEMRQLTALDTPFRLEFRKKDGSRRIVERALLRSQSLSILDRNSAYKLQYIDTVNDQMGSCYIPLITALNERKIILNGQYA